MNERETRVKLKNDYKYFAAKMLKIRPKNSSEQGLQPFYLNHCQRHIHHVIEWQLRTKGYVRIIIVKGRQQGCSTYVGGRFFWKTIHSKGIRAFILTHRDDATDNLFKITQRFYENLPDAVKPFVDRKNAKELSFPLLDSGYKVGTASGTGSVGRSDTIQLFHGSEVALWKNPDEISSGIMQAIPRESEIILESTAKGTGNFFHDQWKKAEKGESEYHPIFIPWYWDENYYENQPVVGDVALTAEEEEVRNINKLSNSQIYWRRKKISEMGEGLFKQEYPMNPVEAFQSSSVDGLIHNDLVFRARKETNVKPYGPIIVGVDPARSENGDSTAIIFRQGRLAYNLKTMKTNDTMQIVGILHNMLKEGTIACMCIDVIGVGAGIVDRLRELGYGNIIKAINAGSTPMNSERYRNKKAEMWGLLKEWLKDYPVQIPDDDILHADLCCVGYSYNSISQLVLEDKDSLKKRGYESPDRAEALALTFAFPINVNVSQIKAYQNPPSLFS